MIESIAVIWAICGLVFVCYRVTMLERLRDKDGQS